MIDSIFSEEVVENEIGLETSLFPTSFNTFIGQQSIKDQVLLAKASAQKRNKPLDHVLAIGPPGVGKSALAKLVSSEGVYVIYCSAVAGVTPFCNALFKARQEDAKFILLEEMHSLGPPAMEVLHSVLDEGLLYLKGPGLSGVEPIDLGKFTVIGTTTKPAKLSEPLLQRFGIPLYFQYYGLESLSKIVLQSSGIMGVSSDSKTSEAIAQVSRGIPRIANRLIARVRDYSDKLTVKSVKEALAFWGIDEFGLTDVDREYVKALAKFGTQPTGASVLSTLLGIDAKTLTSFYEPYLLRAGIIHVTPRGRILSKLGRSVCAKTTLSIR